MDQGPPAGSARTLEVDAIRARFRAFGPEQAAGPHGSPLYVELCRGAAEDPETCALLLSAAPGQRIPNLLLAAVHDLLLAGGSSAADPLAAYYPSVVGATEARPPDADAYASFRDFCTRHRETLLRTIATRSTQTNEPRRAAALVPVLATIGSASGLPVSLLEAGTSAGLLLQSDRYRIRYGGEATGPARSTLTLACRVMGSRPPLPRRLEIAWRAGIDLSPVDINDADGVRWLRACLWPEHRERRANLNAALEIAREHPPLVVRGDMVEELPGLAARAPAGTALVVFHFTALAYLAPERRPLLVDAARSIAASLRRRVWLVGCESIGLFGQLGRDLEQSLLDGLPAAVPDGPACAIVEWRLDPDGPGRHRLLGLVHPHGRWIAWLSNPAV
jgi:hypothetical protein